MNERKRRYFAGERLEQVVVTAARYFGVSPEQIAYRMVPKRHGFVRTPRRLVIEVDPASPTTRPASWGPPEALKATKLAPREAERPPKAPRQGERREHQSALETAPILAQSGPRAERLQPQQEGDWELAPMRLESHEPARPAAVSPGEGAEAALSRLLQLGRLRLEGSVRWAEGELLVELSGADQDRLLADEAEVLEAIEYLLPRMIRQGGAEPPRCRVDSGGYRAGREEGLRQLALSTAEKVRTSGQAVLLEAMGPAERRVVHVTLAGQPGVATESEGDGWFKRVRVAPAPRG